MPKRASRPRAAKTNIGVPDGQWDLPIAYRPDGTMCTLRDVVEKKAPVLSLSQLTARQRAELTAKRIERQPDFRVGMVGAGILNRDRAIAEVQALSPVGRALIEIEQRVITALLDGVAQGGPAPRE